MLSLWSFFAQLNQSNAIITAIVCALLVIVALIILILELNILRRDPEEYLVREENLGKVTVARNSVRHLVGYEAKAIPGVIETRQTVDKGPNGLRVHVRALLYPEVEAAEVGHTLQEKVQKSIQGHLGLPVAEVQVSTQHEPFEKPRRRRVQ
jgi:uncharacterized alkaline shock family protein YloU